MTSGTDSPRRSGGHGHENDAPGCAPLPPTTIIIGRSAAMRSIHAKLEKVAPTQVPVLLQGASGTGKEVLARWIHANSPRHSRPFLKLRCPAMPDPLQEQEMFGPREEGSFADAPPATSGLIEDAGGGTLLLDEIGEMDLDLQTRFLQLLQDNRMRRAGSRAGTAADVRILCATHRDLRAAMAEGAFRPDLFYRINVVSVELPSLRERSGDIPELAEYFVHLCNARYGRNLPPLSPASLQLMLAYDWPGNLRELENVIHRYVIFGSEDSLASELLRGPETAAAAEPISLRKIARQAALDAQRRIILEALHAHRWNRRQAARALHISYRALLYKIHDTGIPSRKDLHNSPGLPGPRPN